MGLIKKENYMKVKSYKTSYILDNIESSVDEFINYNKKLGRVNVC